MMRRPFSIDDKTLQKEKRSVLQDPVLQIDLERTHSISELVASFKNTSIQARRLGEVAAIYERMLKDPERPTVFLGLAGPLIAAGLRKVIRDMIEYGMVDAIVSTGAILYQDYYQACGFQHFKGSAAADDARLRDLFIDRIYDTYVDEEKFSYLDSKIAEFAGACPPGEYSSRSFLTMLAKDITDDHSILATAYRRGIPIFSPALNDSSIGIGLMEHLHRCKLAKRDGITINSIRDNYELTQIVVKSRSTAAFYVAGGVPKNFINDSIVSGYVFGRDTGGHKYAIQLTMDMPEWGGLSGSTLSEATSWGKMKRDATHQTAFVEPSVSMPLVVGYALERKASASRSRIHYEWNDDVLRDISFTPRSGDEAVQVVENRKES